MEDSDGPRGKAYMELAQMYGLAQTKYIGCIISDGNRELALQNIPNAKEFLQLAKSEYQSMIKLGLISKCATDKIMKLEKLITSWENIDNPEGTVGGQE